MLKIINRVAGITAAMMFATTAVAQDFTWKMGHLVPPGSAYLEVVNSIPERISKATDGRVKIELFNTLFQVREQPQALRDGRLDLIGAVHPFLSGTAPSLSAAELPGLVRSIEEYQTALDSGYADHMREVWGRQFNGEVLAIGAFDNAVILSNRSLATAEDFKGLKIRVPSAGAAQLMATLGARPVQLAFPEIAPALSSGVVDAVLTDAGTSHGMGFHNISKFINVWGSGVFSWAIVANSDMWVNVPDDLKSKIEAEFAEIQGEHFANYNSHNAEIIDLMIDAGMTLVEPTEEEIASVYSEKNTAPIYNAFIGLSDKTGSDGESLVATMREALGK